MGQGAPRVGRGARQDGEGPRGWLPFRASKDAPMPVTGRGDVRSQGRGDAESGHGDRRMRGVRAGIRVQDTQDARTGYEDARAWTKVQAHDVAPGTGTTGIRPGRKRDAAQRDVRAQGRVPGCHLTRPRDRVIAWQGPVRARCGNAQVRRQTKGFRAEN